LVWPGRFDHDDVGTLVDIEPDLAQRFLGICRIHLIPATVSERWRRLSGVAKRTIEGRRVLGCVGDDRYRAKLLLIELFANGGNAAVHHIARCDRVCPSLSVDPRCFCQKRECAVVVDLPVFREQPTMSVFSVFTETDIRPDQEVGRPLLDRADGTWNQPVRIVASGTGGVLLIRNPEEDHRGNTQRLDPRGLHDQVVDRKLGDPGHTRDRIPDRLPRHDEEGMDEVVHGEGCLPQHPAPGRSATEPTHSLLWIGHRLLAPSSKRNDHSADQRVKGARLCGDRFDSVSISQSTCGRRPHRRGDHSTKHLCTTIRVQSLAERVDCGRAGEGHGVDTVCLDLIIPVVGVDGDRSVLVRNDLVDNGPETP